MSSQSNDTSPANLRAEFWRLPDEAMVDRPTVAAVCYLSVASMEAMAIRGGSPRYIRLGRRALYLKRDVLEWAEKNGRRVENSAQLAAA